MPLMSYNLLLTWCRCSRRGPKSRRIDAGERCPEIVRRSCSGVCRGC